jgi:hypothetical protein
MSYIVNTDSKQKQAEKVDKIAAPLVSESKELRPCHVFFFPGGFVIGYKHDKGYTLVKTLLDSY